MSDNQSKADQALGETERKIYLTVEDTKNVKDFYTHFEIPIPDGLKTAIEAFEAEQSYENQENFKFETCKDLANSTNEIFTDEMFSNVRQDVSAIAYNMSFNRDLEETLTKTES